jgi:predicted DNA-binding transcriptional regulator YafY
MSAGSPVGKVTRTLRWTPPPLLLDDEEAVAISLHAATTSNVAGLEESSLRALTKLQQTLPSRVWHRIAAFHATTVPLPGRVRRTRPPSDDVAAYMPQSISSAPYRYQARVLIRAPLAAVARSSSPAAGRLEAVDHYGCVLHTGSNSLDELALFVVLKGFDFQVLDPPELIPVLRTFAARLRHAADAS